MTRSGLVLMGAAVIALTLFWTSTEPQSGAYAQNAGHGALAPLIDGDYTVAAPGRVEPASDAVQLSASVTGLLKEVPVKEGDMVKKDQIVAQIENAEYTTQLARADADVRIKEAELERVQNGARNSERREAKAAVDEAKAVESTAQGMLDRRQRLAANAFAAQETVDQSEREYKVAHERLAAAEQHFALINDPARNEDVAIAEANLDAAKAARDNAAALLDKTIIRSPMDGTVLRVDRHPGELLSIFFDKPILTVGDLSHLLVRADVDETDIAKIALGVPAYVTAEAYGERHFAGKVVRIGQELGKKNFTTDAPGEHTDTKILEVMIELQNPNPLRPGLRVNAFFAKPRPDTEGRS